jgi:hypothetical protein
MPASYKSEGRFEMKKKILVSGLTVAFALLIGAGAPAQASCPVTSQPVYHGFSGFVAGCKDATPVSGFAYLEATPTTVNSNGQDLLCEIGGATTGVGLTCQPEAGVAGDGFVTVQYDWGAFNGGPNGALGCPNPSGVGVGFPIAVQVVCNDGATAILEAHYFEGQAAYLMDTSGPADGTPPSASFANAPSFVPNCPAGTYGAHQPTPAVYSDCDDTSLGFGTTCLTPTDKVVVTTGNFYTKNDLCNISPDPRLSTGWVLSNAPVTAGNACIPITKPATGCAYIGATARLGTTETVGVVGAFQIAGQIAAVDKVTIDKALFSRGSLHVDISTINETAIVGFNVYAGTTKLNGNLIQAKGTGSNAYPFEADRAAVKSNKTVSVEVVMKDGSVQKVGPVSVK